MDEPHVDLDDPENAAILDYLRSINDDDLPAFFQVDPEPGPARPWYAFWRPRRRKQRYGCHPEAGEYLFEKAACGVDGAAPRILYGRDCLVDPSTGRILGFCQGMCYALRLPLQSVATALAAIERRYEPAHPEIRASAESWARKVRALGPEWVPGSFSEEEAEWLRGPSPTTDGFD